MHFPRRRFSFTVGLLGRHLLPSPRRERRKVCVQNVAPARSEAAFRPAWQPPRGASRACRHGSRGHHCHCQGHRREAVTSSPPGPHGRGGAAAPPEQVGPQNRSNRLLTFGPRTVCGPTRLWPRLTAHGSACRGQGSASASPWGAGRGQCCEQGRNRDSSTLPPTSRDQGRAHRGFPETLPRPSLTLSTQGSHHSTRVQESDTGHPGHSGLAPGSRGPRGEILAVRDGMALRVGRASGDPALPGSLPTSRLRQRSARDGSKTRAET